MLLNGTRQFTLPRPRAMRSGRRRGNLLSVAGRTPSGTPPAAAATHP